MADAAFADLDRLGQPTLLDHSFHRRNRAAEHMSGFSVR